MKRFLSACLVAVLALSTTACSSAGGDPSSSPAAPSSQSSTAASSNSEATPAVTGQTLKVLLSEEPASGDSLMATLKRWAEETGNTIEPMVIPYDDQLTKFPLMARNKDLPDLIATTRLTRLYPEEFVDLNDILDISLFEPKALEIIGQDYSSDSNYSAPLQFTITTVYYNADAFEKAAITAPTVDKPWTIDELYANAEKLQQDGGVKYGAAVDFSRARYDNLMYINGGSMVEKDGDTFKVSINSQKNIDALQKFVDMNNKGVLPKAIWAGGSTDNPADYFKNGDLGIYFTGSWNYNTFTNEIQSFQWGVMPSPVGASPSAILGGSGLAIPANAANKETAASFLKWLYETPDNFQKYLDNDKGLSSLVGVSYTPENPEAAAHFQVMQAEVGNVCDRFSVDETSTWRNYKDNEYRDYLKQAVNGDMSASDALNEFAKELSEKSGWAIAG